MRSLKAAGRKFLRRRDFLMENLSLLMASGMGISHALDAIAGEAKAKGSREAVDFLIEEVEAGSPFWRALEKLEIFPDHTISLLRIGEQSGRLANNLKVVSLQQDKERVFRSQLRSAMLYPVIVFGMALVIGIGISWFVLPRLAKVFSQLNIELPAITRFTLGFGAFFADHGLVIVPLLLGFFAVSYYLLFENTKTKGIGQALLFVFPGVKGLIRDLEISRFGYLLGTLLDAGVNIDQALISVEQSTELYAYKRLYRHLGVQIDEGLSFQKAFLLYPKATQYLPGSVQRMIVAGEQSGNLATSLLKLSASFEAKTEAATKNLTVILEPLMLVVVWLAVLGVALSVILPIYGLIGGFDASGG